jgi:hypothetical protein
MFTLSSSGRLVCVAIIACSVAACAAEPESTEVGEAQVSSGSSELLVVPLGAFSVNNAMFGTLGLGGVATTATTGAVGTVTTGGTVSGGPMGFSTGTGFNTGPVGFSTGFNTGPITTSFNSGPITTGGTTTMTSGTGTAPVITNTCVGLGCP